MWRAYKLQDEDNDPVQANIADNDWKITAFRMRFDNDQGINRDSGMGAFSGWDWVDEDNDGVHDGKWFDWDLDGIADAHEPDPQPASYVRSGGRLDANGDPTDTIVRIRVEFDIEGTMTGTWNITGEGNGWTFAKPGGASGRMYAFAARDEAGNELPLGDTIEFFENLETTWKLERTPPVDPEAEGVPPTTDEDYGTAPQGISTHLSA